MDATFTIIDAQWQEVRRIPAIPGEPFRFSDPATGTTYEKCGPGTYRVAE